MKKYLGLDWGQKRIGLALADNEIKIASPFKTVNNLADVLEIIKSEEIDIIILGHPIKLSGDLEIINPDFKNFLSLLKNRSKLPVILFDERLTSKVENYLNKHDKDAMAACLILQSYLDNLNS